MRRTSKPSLRAIPVTRSQVQSYGRVKPNPLGVTRMARVNGRTSANASSVRRSTAAMTPAERARYARSLVRSGAKRPVASASRPYAPNPVRASSLPKFARPLKPNTSSGRTIYGSAGSASPKRRGNKGKRKFTRNAPQGENMAQRKKAAKGAAKAKKRKSPKRRSAPKAVAKRKSPKRRSAPKPAAKRKSPKRRSAPKPAAKRKSSKRKPARRSSSRRRSIARRSDEKRHHYGVRLVRRRGKKARGLPVGSATRRAARSLGRRGGLAAQRKRRGALKPNRRRRARKGMYMTPNSATKALVATLKVAGLATGGFLAHRVLTQLIDTQLAAATAPAATSGTASDYRKEIVSGGVALLGAVGAIYAGRMMGGTTDNNPGLAIAAGMVTSSISQVLVSLLAKSTNPTAAQILPYVSGVGGYRATQLLGTRRRGFGATQSLMPRYAPMGAFTQAAAGYSQAAAGFTQAAAGMLPRSAGEYFAPNGTRGVGNYEAAGELATQAAAGAAMVPIDDGIRPTANLDMVSAAMDGSAGLMGARGFRRSRQLGEYWTVTGGEGATDIPEDDQWVPSGPLWAGTADVTDDQAKSDLPAGIFADAGGNGIFSA